jgi:hypothetical protein
MKNLARKIARGGYYTPRSNIKDEKIPYCLTEGSEYEEDISIFEEDIRTFMEGP